MLVLAPARAPRKQVSAVAPGFVDSLCKAMLRQEASPHQALFGSHAYSVYKGAAGGTVVSFIAACPQLASAAS